MATLSPSRPHMLATHASRASRVQVAARVRPLLPSERVRQCKECITATSDRELVVGTDRRFTFDHAVPASATQAELYDRCVAPLVDGCFSGYNATVFAYGQTGSGKTYSMGSGGESSVPESGPGVGIIPRVVDHIFSVIRAEESRAEFLVRVSFLEIYQENLRDLLQPGTPSKGLAIREDAAGGIVVTGAHEGTVTSVEEAQKVLRQGAVCRTTGSTLMNQQSSRSHAIFTIIVEQRRTGEGDGGGESGGEGGGEGEGKSGEGKGRSGEGKRSGGGSGGDGGVQVAGGGAGKYTRAKFHLVDLAGSERNKRTRTEGERFREGVRINQGLLALGNVISALGDKSKWVNGKTGHVPYRDSKLTRMLQDSLGGNSRTLMLACVSPADENFAETLNVLKYANRARNIKNAPRINNDPEAGNLAKLQEEIRSLQQQLQAAQGGLPGVGGIGGGGGGGGGVGDNNMSVDRAILDVLRKSTIGSSVRGGRGHGGGDRNDGGQDGVRGGGRGRGRVEEQLFVATRVIQSTEDALVAMRGRYADGASFACAPEQVLEEVDACLKTLRGVRKAGVGDDGRVAPDGAVRAAGDAQVALVREKLREAQMDLAQDEQIFAAKMVEMRALQQQVQELYSANDYLRQQLAAADVPATPVQSPCPSPPPVDGNENPRQSATGTGRSMAWMPDSSPANPCSALEDQDEVMYRRDDGEESWAVLSDFDVSAAKASAAAANIERAAATATKAGVAPPDAALDNLMRAGQDTDTDVSQLMQDMLVVGGTDLLIQGGEAVLSDAASAEAARVVPGAKRLTVEGATVTEVRTHGDAAAAGSAKSSGSTATAVPASMRRSANNEVLLRDLGMNIRLKEELIRTLMLNDRKSQRNIAESKSRVTKLEHEVEELRGKVGGDQDRSRCGGDGDFGGDGATTDTGAAAAAAETSDTYKDRLRAAEAKLQAVRQRQQEQERQVDADNVTRVNELESQLQQMRREQDIMTRRRRQDDREDRARTEVRDREVAGLRTDVAARETRIVALEEENKRQRHLLARQQEEGASRGRDRGAQDASTTGTDDGVAAAARASLSVAHTLARLDDAMDDLVARQEGHGRLRRLVQGRLEAEQRRDELVVRRDEILKLVDPALLEEKQQGSASGSGNGRVDLDGDGDSAAEQKSARSASSGRERDELREVGEMLDTLRSEIDFKTQSIAEAALELSATGGGGEGGDDSIGVAGFTERSEGAGVGGRAAEAGRRRQRPGSPGSAAVAVVGRDGDGGAGGSVAGGAGVDGEASVDAVDMQHMQDIYALVEEVSVDEARELLKQSCVRVAALKKRTAVEARAHALVELRLVEQEEHVVQLESMLARAHLDFDRRLVQAQQAHESKISSLLTQVHVEAKDDKAWPREQQQQSERLRLLEKDNYYYKQTARELKRKLRDVTVLEEKLDGEKEHSDVLARSNAALREELDNVKAYLRRVSGGRRANADKSGALNQSDSGPVMVRVSKGSIREVQIPGKGGGGGSGSRRG